MTRFRQRYHAVWGSAEVQNIAEYVLMVAVILVLVIGTLKLIRKHGNGPSAVPATVRSTKQ